MKTKKIGSHPSSYKKNAISVYSDWNNALKQVSTVGHPDFQLFSSFLVFCDFFDAVFCPDSKNVLKKCDLINFWEDMGEGFDPPFFQNLVKILNCVFSSQIMILRVILFERAFNSVQLKTNCLNQEHTQKFLKGGLNFLKSNQYPIVVNLVIVKQGFAVIVASLEHLFIPKPCNNDFKSCWL